ncbi:hypothetical protein AYO44_00580 [Planctomycetaceae bacterium SCGC AG-212-F19]|nr:hypothetical protein AYO44_00580 [Planctomycetaceae bacterium SCGC AG-212-F19]
MKRLLMLLAVLAAVAVGAHLSRPVIAADKADAPFVHTVIFYLKKDAPKDEGKALVDDATELLAKIPSVRMVKIGPPSDKTTPKVGVTDYQVGLLVLFDNADGLKTYLDHPLHVKYVEKHEKHIDKVLVYDFVNQAK